MSVFGLDQDYTEDELRHCVTKWPLWSMVRKNVTCGVVSSKSKIRAVRSSDGEEATAMT